MKKCIIFGCGYVGTHFAKQAIQLGYQVSALTRNDERVAELKEIGVSKVVQCDLDSDQWHQEFRGEYQFVVNAVSSAGNGMEGYRKSYLNGQESIARWIASEKVKVGTWVFTGSTSVYPQSGDAAVTENASHQGVGESGQILLEAEAVMKDCEQFIGRWFVARLAGIYGPSRHYIWDQLKAGSREFAGACHHYVNYIHLEDICTALWAIVDSVLTNKNKVYNVADGQPTRKKELILWVAKELGIEEGEIQFQPGKVFSKRRVLFNGEIPSRIISANRIMKELAWKPMYPDFRCGYRKLMKLDAE